MSEQKVGRLFSFEGVDGSGKTTIIERVKMSLEQQGYSVCVIREPGTTILGEQIRAILKDTNTPKTKRAEVLLFLASRADMVETTLSRVQSAYDYIILDRFTDSTLAYQGFGNGHTIAMLQQLNAFCTKGLQPEQTFLLDVTPEVAKARRNVRAGEVDMFDSDEEFAERVRKGYAELAKMYPDRIRVIDNSAPIETSTVASDIVAYMTSEHTVQTIKRPLMQTITPETPVRMTVEAFSKYPDKYTGELHTTVLVKNVTNTQTGEIVTDHTYIPYDYEFAKIGNFVPGDVLEGKIELTTYRKQSANGDFETCIGVKRLIEGEIVHQVVVPADARIAFNFERGPLPHLLKHTNEQDFNEAAAKHANYIQRIAYEYLYPERSATKVKRFDPSKLKATQPDVKKTTKVVLKATTPQVKRPYTIRRGGL